MPMIPKQFEQLCLAAFPEATNIGVATCPGSKVLVYGASVTIKGTLLRLGLSYPVPNGDECNVFVLDPALRHHCLVRQTPDTEALARFARQVQA